MRTFVMTLCIVALVSCRQKMPTTLQPEYQPFYKAEEFAHGINTITMVPGDSMKSAPAQLIKNRYGQFFYGRADYYVIEKPTNKLMDSDVLRATLYYFDRKLYRVQYVVANDVSYKLINSLPRFSIVALNQESRNCLKNEPAVLRLSDSTILLNPNLGDFELRWKKENTIVKWRSNKSGNKFEYSEIDTGYVRKYNQLGKYEFDVERKF